MISLVIYGRLLAHLSEGLRRRQYTFGSSHAREKGTEKYIFENGQILPYNYC